MTFETIIGTIAGILTCTSMIPQLVKVLRTKDVEDLSWIMICVLLGGVSLWTYYGILQNEWPIIVTNAFSMLTNSFLLFLVWRYRKKR
jgi:MtN3 and saliva related transmembrane protein